MSIAHIGSGQDLDECTDGNYKVSECQCPESSHTTWSTATMQW